MDYVIETDNLTKTFDNVTALDRVELKIPARSIVSASIALMAMGTSCRFSDRFRAVTTISSMAIDSDWASACGAPVIEATAIATPATKGLT